MANSLYNVHFWNKIDLWWQENSPTEYKYQDGIELCAMHWKNNVNEILNNKSLFKDRYLEIRYEDICSGFRKEILKILEFCELEINEYFLEVMPNSLPNQNSKWQENLSKHQQENLINVLKGDLKKLEYLI